MMRNLKYTFVYVIPMVSIIAIMCIAKHSLITVLAVFGIISVAKILLSPDDKNHSAEVSDTLVNKKIFDRFLYMSTTIVYGIGIHYLYTIETVPLQAYELVGLLSVAIIFSANSNNKFFSLNNEMSIISILHVLILVGIYLSFGGYVLAVFCMTVLVSMILLETINHIEDYGLRRSYNYEKYDRVTLMHSWKYNNEIGRILLYELTMHSDHHYTTNIKYQMLDNHQESRQLPLEYPGSMLSGKVPPIFV